ncbi:EAL domain-containing protein [Bacillus sp. FJAT-49732]|uniref:EAL domain-containing protein n=1 Tax=Lederbergia citrisecunda TaxID=2833583 RepID=A0A942TMQ7_9BACI|nr:EAL domain-containing protein [Lederbergia citrisecunda]MBS4201131.1 EAL domain-containing protein [Lederbergia citrisecunda]
MRCNHCLVEELVVEMIAEGEHNLKILLEVEQHLNRRNMFVTVNGNMFKIKESGVREFLDFCNDHMESEKVWFRLNGQDWKPISEIITILDMQWIDEVIIKQLITCHFQPIVDAQEEIYAYEILSRFKKHDGSLIFPNEVFSAAKIRGRLYALDRLCRMTAVRHAAILNKKAFINFIPTSIYSPEYCLKSTAALAKQLGIDPSLFVFEVVETEKVEDIDHLKKILSYYREKGFQYALDDVGEGYSTLELLSDLVPHFMKLDMKYVQGVAKDSKKQHIASVFLEKALTIGSIPLAEGVESTEDFQWLKGKGYQLFQGYLFGKPSSTPYEGSIEGSY